MYDIVYIVIHQNYKHIEGRTSPADVALIRLEQKLPMNLEDFPILNYERIAPGSEGAYYAFGGHEGWSNLGWWSSHMKYAFIKTMVPDCADYILDDLMIICWTHIGGTEAYHGDSGSPIFFGEKKEAPFYKSVIGSVLATVTKGVNRKTGENVHVNKGVRISFYYFWIKHIIYFDTPVPKSNTKVLYCCKQESLGHYCIRKVRYRDFRMVEKYPINAEAPHEGVQINTCSKEYYY